MEGVFWYVYMLQSVEHPEHYYVGITEDLPERLKCHNAGKVPHTAKFLPWRIETATAFRTTDKAIAELEREMLAAADELDAERAARARYRIAELKEV